MHDGLSQWVTPVAIFFGAAATFVGSFVGYVVYLRTKERYRLVGTVSKIIIYPVKALAGLEVTKAECTAHGLEVGDVIDRMWLIMDEEKKVFIDNSYEPKISLLQPMHPFINDDDLYVKYARDPLAPPLKLPIIKRCPQNPKFEECRIFSKIVRGIHTGTEISKWIRDFTGKPSWAIIQSIEHLIDAEEEYSQEKQDELMRRPKTNHIASPYHIITMPSLNALNRRFEKDQKVSYKVFRANIVIDGTDLEPFQEDKWTHLEIGDAEFEVIEPCDRRMTVNVNPETGDWGTDVMKTLRQFRLATKPEHKRKYGNAPLFGLLYELRRRGTIYLGDSVYAK